MFHRLLAAASLMAWISIAMQAEVLIGSRGLLPITDLLGVARERGATGFQIPTWFWIESGDGAVKWGVLPGALLAALALVGKWPRTCLALSTALYLGYAIACRTFMGFQWDNLLVECGVLAVLLPADRPARWAHLLMRLLLFKVYFESGMSKWMSHLGDWRDGIAMSLYYETAPLPTPLAHWAHALPGWWHRLETWGTLAFELVVPWFIFGPRRLRLVALAMMTAFQIAVAATANYGFFCFLVGVLGVFLLSERDALLLGGWLRLRRAAPPIRQGRRAVVDRVVATTATTLWLSISFVEAMAFFDKTPVSNWEAVAGPLRRFHAQFRVANTYHLFGHVTRERIESEFQTFDGAVWTAHALRYKPADPKRRPPWVAPHQPRVDFQLWFHGLGFRRGPPPYARVLLDRMCHDADAVADLFAAPLPRAPRAVRIAYWRTTFTTPQERRRTGAWWNREWVSASEELRCSR